MAEYIERKAVFDKLAVIYDLARTNQRAVITDALREVSHIPAEDVQPVKRGKWEGVDYDTFFKCSECGHMTDWQLYKYCPNCGARMLDD